jgi:hypothetical protein
MNSWIPLAMLISVGAVFAFLGSVAREMVHIRDRKHDNSPTGTNVKD